MMFSRMDRIDPLAIASRVTTLLVVFMAALWVWSYVSMETLSIRAFGRGWDLTCLHGVIYTDYPPLQIDDIDIGLTRYPAEDSWFTAKYREAPTFLGFCFATRRPGSYLIGVPIWPAFVVVAVTSGLIFRARRAAIARAADAAASVRAADAPK